MSNKSSTTTLLEYYKRAVKFGEKKAGIARHHPAIALMYLIVVIHKLTNLVVNRKINKEDYDSYMGRLRYSFQDTAVALSGNWNPYLEFYFTLHTIDVPVEYWEPMKHAVPPEIRNYIDHAIQAYPEP